MSTHNICFHAEIRKIFTGYPPISRPMEVPQQGTSNEYPQICLHVEIRKLTFLVDRSTLISRAMFPHLCFRIKLESNSCEYLNSCSADTPTGCDNCIDL